MLRVVINISVFGAFVLIVAVLGFFLWQTLFAVKEYSNEQEKFEATYSEQRPGNENTVRSSPSPNQAEATDKAIAEYTKWLAIFTLFLVLATIGLFISGERNIEVARQTAAKQLRVMQGQLASMMAGQRPWVYADIALYKPLIPLAAVFGLRMTGCISP
jgi:cytoskeletal protein RodZ